MTPPNPIRLFAVGYAASLLALHVAHLARATRYRATAVRLAGARPDIVRTLRPPPPRFLGLVPIRPLGARATAAFGLTLAVSLLPPIIGGPPVLVRAALTLASAAALMFFSQLRDLFTVRRKANTIPILLAILAAAPGVAAPWSAAPPRWPLFLAGMVIVQVYFSAGVEKLRETGWRWADGRVFEWAVTHFRLWQRPEATTVGWPHWMFRAASFAALSVELTSPLALTSIPMACAYAAVALVFHVLTSFALRIHYFFIYPGYAVILALLIGARTTWWTPTGIVVSALMAALLTIVTVTGRRAWPFDRYPMYASAPPGLLIVHRLALDHRDGSSSWWVGTISNDLERVSQLLDGAVFRGGTGRDTQEVVAAALALAPPSPGVISARVVQRTWDGRTVTETSLPALNVRRLPGPASGGSNKTMAFEVASS